MRCLRLTCAAAALLLFSGMVACQMPDNLCFNSPITTAALSAGVIGGGADWQQQPQPQPQPQQQQGGAVSVYQSHTYCLFQLSARYFLTWQQAAQFCALYNATLPALRTPYGWRQVRVFARNRRFWAGFVRHRDGARWTRDSGAKSDAPLNTDDFVTSGNLTGIVWTASEPSNSYCAENCTIVSNDGGLADYPCGTVPPWDSCSDATTVVLTVCHRSREPVCEFIQEPPTVPTPRDYYIIIGVTFAAFTFLAATTILARTLTKVVDKRSRRDIGTLRAQDKKLRQTFRHRDPQG